MKLFPVLVSIISLSIGISCTKDVGQNPDLLPRPLEGCDTVTFTKHILPISTNSCVTCHSPGAQSPDLSNYALIKAQADAGRIKARVIDQMPSVMPQGGPLPNAELDLIKCWLNAGAPNN